jgi:hypothetical protein
MGFLLIPGKNEGTGSENKAVADFLVTVDVRKPYFYLIFSG